MARRLPREEDFQEYDEDDEDFDREVVDLDDDEITDDDLCRGAAWPVDIWVPGEGWIQYGELSPEAVIKAVIHADVHGDLEHLVSRWHDGLRGARSIGALGLGDFAPGPGDLPNVEGTQGLAHYNGFINPTRNFMYGRRLYFVVGSSTPRTLRSDACLAEMDLC